MGGRTPTRLQPKRLLLLCLCGLLTAGCGATNLGDIDETQSERDAMPGPGVFTGEDGVASLRWDGDSGAAEQGAEMADKADDDVVTAASTPPAMDEKAEFEAFKQWQRLRAEGAESAEYQEFLQWLEFQRFKATEQ